MFGYGILDECFAMLPEKLKCAHEFNYGEEDTIATSLYKQPIYDPLTMKDLKKVLAFASYEFNDIESIHKLSVEILSLISRRFICNLEFLDQYIDEIREILDKMLMAIDVVGVKDLNGVEDSYTSSTRRCVISLNERWAALSIEMLGYANERVVSLARKAYDQLLEIKFGIEVSPDIFFKHEYVFTQAVTEIYDCSKYVIIDKNMAKKDESCSKQQDEFRTTFLQILNDLLSRQNFTAREISYQAIIRLKHLDNILK